MSRVNNHLIHWRKTAETDKWSEAEDLKGFLTTPPTAVSRAPGYIDVFARGADGGLWHLALDSSSNNNDTWSGWRRLGGDTEIDGQPHAVSSDADSVDVFAWGAADGALLHTTYDAAAGAWRAEGDGDGDAGFATLVADGLVGPPSAAVDGTGDVYVFAYNRRNELVWLTLGPDKTPRGDASVLAEVPYNVA